MSTNPQPSRSPVKAPFITEPKRFDELNKSNNDQLREYHRSLEANHPALWMLCYPRVHQNPPHNCGDYSSPKEPARFICEAALAYEAGCRSQHDNASFNLARELSRFDVPTFWIARDMAEALAKTKPPQVISWPEMHLPFDAAVFMLPKGTLVHALYGEVSFIAYARVKAGDETHLPVDHLTGHGQQPFRQAADGLIIVVQTASGISMNWTLDRTVNNGLITMVDMSALRRGVEAQSQSGEHSASHDASLPLCLNDHSVLEGALHQLINVLLVIAEYPTLVTGGSRTKLVKAKKGKRRREFCSPRIVGMDYKVRRAASTSLGGTHNSPRLHWVRGHFKEQACGTGFLLRKKRWQEPYLRGVHL